MPPERRAPIGQDGAAGHAGFGGGSFRIWTGSCFQAAEFLCGRPGGSGVVGGWRPILSYFLSSIYRAYFVPRGTVLGTGRQRRRKRDPCLEERERKLG